MTWLRAVSVAWLVVASAVMLIDGRNNRGVAYLFVVVWSTMLLTLALMVATL